MTNLFHTCDISEKNVPHFCGDHDGDAWLGKGYYFWDSFIELSHWWGNQFYKSGYKILRGSIDLSTAGCLDLNSSEGMTMLSDSIGVARAFFKIPKPNLKQVIQVILKYHSYECVRFDSTGCCGSMTSKETLDVENGAGICKFKYVFKRQIQVCFFRKNVNLWSALQQIYPVVEEFA